MIRSNIQGLSGVLNSLEKRIVAMERKPLNITGGENIRITRMGSGLIINADPAGDSGPAVTAEKCPLDILRTAQEPTTAGDDIQAYDISVRLGTIGGFAPANWEDVGEIGVEESKFLQARITADEKNISTVELELADEVEGCIKVEQNNPPAEFTILIGALLINESEDDQGVTTYGAHHIHRAIACGSVGLHAEMIGDNCWTWIVS
jgi:hypothetical protein